MQENCLILRNCEKEELLSAITETLQDRVLNLMSTAEAADLLHVNISTISKYKKIGLLTDYSVQNENRKFSATEVLNLRRSKSERKNITKRGVRSL